MESGCLRMACHLHYLGLGERLRYVPDVLHPQPGGVGIYHILDRYRVDFLTFFTGAFSGRLLDAGLYVPCLMVGSTIQLLGIFLMSISRVIGFLNLALLVIVVAFMRPRLPPRKSGPIIDSSAWREPPYAFYVSGLFFAVWAIYYTFYYVASFGVQNLGLKYSASTALVIIINGVGVPARVVPPYFGRLNLLVPILAGMTIVTYCWLAVDSVPGLYVFTVLCELVSASFQCLMPSTVASLTPDLRMVGTRLGMAFSTLSFAALTGPPIGGALQSAMGGKYTGATVFAAISTLLCFFLIGAARVAKVGLQIRKKC